jgi:hypothetical protein
MAARASDSHPPGQLNDSRGTLPSSILPDPPTAVKQKPAMSQGAGRLRACPALIGQFRKNARAAGRTLHGCLAAKFFPPIRLRAASAPNGRCPAKRQEAIADNADG